MFSKIIQLTDPIERLQRTARWCPGLEQVGS